MATPTAQPTNYSPELPTEYVGDFTAGSGTLEATLLHMLLTTPAAVYIAHGMGGTGKTTALAAVAAHPRVRARFTRAVWFIALGYHARPADLLSNVEHVVRAVVGEADADKVAQLARVEATQQSAMAHALSILGKHPILLLFDDVWADNVSQALGRPTVFSLVRHCIRALERNPPALNVVLSSRDHAVADLVLEPYRISASVLQKDGSLSKRILCKYAGIARAEAAQAEQQESFHAVLAKCAGLHLALAVAGSAVAEMITRRGVRKLTVWDSYIQSLERMRPLLSRSSYDHPGIFAMIRSSLDAIAENLQRCGASIPCDAHMLFSSLSVTRKQQTVPMFVLECIWGMEKDATWEVCLAFDRFHLIEVRDVDSAPGITFHDLVHDYLTERSAEAGTKRERELHSTLVQRLYLRFQNVSPPSSALSECRDWSTMCKALTCIAARRYVTENVVRHLCHAELIDEALHLLCDYRWAVARLAQSSKSNGISAFVEDIETVVSMCETQLTVDIRTGLDLISDAARLSSPYIANNPRELAFQLHGRLAYWDDQSMVVHRFLWSLEQHAERPWLRSAPDVLTHAGSSVVLNASFPCALSCIDMLPNGDDVVVGGVDGYLVIYSLRYGAVQHDLRGHFSVVNCVAVSPLKGRVLSGGADGTIRVWEIGTGQEAREPLVRNRASVQSLCITEDESLFAFCDMDKENPLVRICNAETGETRTICQGHTDEIRSISLGRCDQMIVSGSGDGTVRRWKVENGEEVGDLISVADWRVENIIVSCDGKRVAFASLDKIAVSDFTTGQILRECEPGRQVFCIAFAADNETVFFGGFGGITAAMAPDGNVTSKVTVHGYVVRDMVVSINRRLLISVSYDGALSAQRLEKIESASEGSKELKVIRSFVVLRDRQRVLFCFKPKEKSSFGLRHLDLRDRLTRNQLERKIDVEKLSVCVGEPDVPVTAIGVSPDGTTAIIGALRVSLDARNGYDGEILVYQTDDWERVFLNLRRLPGDIWGIAVSRDNSLFAVGCSEGSIALFRLEDGNEISLPSSTGKGHVLKLCFGEESSSLLALTTSPTGGVGRMHIWNHIHHNTNISYDVKPLEDVTGYPAGFLSTAILASETHIAVMDPSFSATRIFELATNRLVLWDVPGTPSVLRSSAEEHKALQTTGSLSMEPFGVTIKYHEASGLKILGTLESRSCFSFRPDQWVFDNHTGLFLSSGFERKLISAMLVRGISPAESALSGIPSPELPVLTVGTRTSTQTGGKCCEVFISHAGVDKDDVAIPLWDRLEDQGIPGFVDKMALRPGSRGIAEMDSALEHANIGVFIISPEFAGRRWPLRELMCFLSRVRHAEVRGQSAPTIIPVFYRLDVHACRSPALYNHQSETGRIIFEEGFFDAARQAEIPTEKAAACMYELTSFTGVENEEGALSEADCTGDRARNRRQRELLIDRVAAAVVEARLRRQRDSTDTGGESQKSMPQPGQPSDTGAAPTNRQSSWCTVS